MALDIEIERDGIRDLSTCGEISTLLSVGKKEFFLNCKYCEYICLQLEDFIQHIYNDHLEQFDYMNYKSKNHFSPIVQSEAQIDDMDNAEFYGDFEKDEETVVPYFEKVEIDTTEISNDCNTLELYTEHQMNEEISEEQSIEIDDVKVEHLLETREDTDSGGEATPKGQYNLWDKHFDLPEHKKKADLLRRQAKKKFILEFIEIYRSLPALWNSKSKVYFNREKKSEQYEILLKKFKEQYPSATREDVVKQINTLRTCYKKELRNIGPSGISTLYYFDAMNFLRSIITLPEAPSQQKIPQATPKKPKQRHHTFLPSASLLKAREFINLAKLYKKYSCLWDENDIAYFFANRRREALKNILDEINKASELKLTNEDLAKEISLLRKLCSIEKKEKIACKRNKQLYKPAWPFFEQIAYLEPDVTPYQCSICDKLLFTSHQQKIHEASHDGSLPFKCKVCGHGFKLNTNLGVHLRRHVHEYAHKCKVCDKPCVTSTELKIHMRSHTGDKPYICEICGKKFPTNAALSKHMNVHEPKEKKFKCEICAKPFYDKKRVREHMIVHTRVRDKICNVCNKGFGSIKHLRQHQLIHNPEKKYKCEVCGKRFAQRAGLNGHMKSHGMNFTTNGTDS